MGYWDDPGNWQDSGEPEDDQGYSIHHPMSRAMSGAASEKARHAERQQRVVLVDHDGMLLVCAGAHYRGVDSAPSFEVLDAVPTDNKEIKALVVEFTRNRDNHIYLLSTGALPCSVRGAVCRSIRLIDGPLSLNLAHGIVGLDHLAADLEALARSSALLTEWPCLHVHLALVCEVFTLPAGEARLRRWGMAFASR